MKFASWIWRGPRMPFGFPRRLALANPLPNPAIAYPIVPSWILGHCFNRIAFFLGSWQTMNRVWTYGLPPWRRLYDLRKRKFPLAGIPGEMSNFWGCIFNSLRIFCAYLGLQPILCPPHIRIVFWCSAQIPVCTPSADNRFRNSLAISCARSLCFA